MSIEKKAIAILTDVRMISGSTPGDNIKLASNRLIIDANSVAKKVVDAEIQKHPTALFFRAKAIAADETNSNGDFFSSEELIKSAGTFVGVPFYTNHENTDITKAKGKIVFSEWVPNEKAIYVIGFVDREAYPGLARGIEQDYMRGVSMGCVVEYSKCSICMNKAATVEEYCFVPGTPVLMSDLTVKPIEQVIAGDMVIDVDGKVTKVIAPISHNVSETIQVISSRSINNELGCTGNHPILTTRRGGYRYVEAGMLDDKDTLLTPIWSNESDETVFDTIDFDKTEENKIKVARLIGYYAAEGCISTNHNPEVYATEFSVNQNETSLIADIADIALTVFGKTVSQFDSKGSQGTSIRIYHPELAKFLQANVPGKAKTKTLSCAVVKLPTNLIKEVVSGYIDGDGHVSSSSQIVIHTASQSLAFQFFHLLLRLGVTPCLNSFDQFGGPTNREKLCHIYRLGFGTSQARKISDCGAKVHMASISKKAEKNKLSKAFTEDGKYAKHSAYDIDEVEFSGLVYNIETESHSYVVNNTAVHNCTHVKHLKGRKFSGTAKDVETGELKTFKMAHVYEINHGVRFIELSGVGDPACKSCRIQGVYDNDEHLAKAASCDSAQKIGTGRSFLSKVACIENSLFMYKDTGLYKQASQEELQQIEEVLKTLEQISVNLIKNRKRVEVEFASDLVQILSELQEFSDELTGAGYGQLQGEPPADGAIGGAGGLPPPAEGVPTEGGTGMAMPVSDILGGDLTGGEAAQPSGQPGTISGSPSKPVVTIPKMPTAPKKPMSSGGADRMHRIAELIATVRMALDDNNEGEDVMKRRTPTVASQDRESAINALSGTNKGIGTVSENVVRYVDSKKTGGANMSDTVMKAASRSEAPAVLPEKQLDGVIANHPRTGEEPRSTGEVQLEGKRIGNEPQKLTESQIEGKRKDNAPEVLSEKQIDGQRKNDEPTSTQEVQLESLRSNNDLHVTHEKQLDGKKSSLWERASMRRSTVKTASMHTRAVIRVLAESAVRCSATPQQIKAAAVSLVAGTQARTSTLDQITDGVSGKVEAPESVVARARYWGGKGVTLAAATASDMKTDIIAGLKVLVAFDEEISPEVVMDVLDVVGSEDGSLESISAAIDGVIQEPVENAVAASSSSRREIRATILEGEKTVTLDKPPAAAKPRSIGQPPESVNARAQERADMKAKLAAKRPGRTVEAKRPTHTIEASLKEIGTSLDEINNNKSEAKKKIIAFVKRVSEMQNLTVEKMQVDKAGRQVLVANQVKQLKVANITNVQVDGKDGTVSIAIQTDEGDTTADVSIPLDEQGADVAGAPAEGDATGESLDNLIGGDTGAATSTPPVGGAAPTAPSPEAPLPTAASKQRVKTAQVGGAGGGLPGGGNLGGGQDPASSLPGTPAMDGGEGLQTLTDSKKESDDEAPGVGEQMMPGSICPFCHGTDTTTGKKELPAGAFECNNCGAIYEVHVNIEVLNPEKMSFEKGGADDAEVTEPKLPSMPVAAVTKLDKAGMEKTASCEQKYGHVCPACGMTECKPSEKTASTVSYICPSCETKTTKSVVVAHDKTPYLSVAWDLDPKKIVTAGCKTCKQAAAEYVARIKVAKMMAKAASNEKDPKTAFPEANCAEYISRRWGANAVATNGPCKGKPLAACICNQLKAFGLRKRIDVEKLAGVYMQDDPMDKCLQIQTGKGYKAAQAQTLCNALKKKYAKETDENEWLEAFAGDSRFSTEELRVMKQKSNAMLSAQAQVGFDLKNLDADIGDPIDDVVPVADAGGEETVTVEIPEDLAKELAGQIDSQVSAKEDGEIGGEPEDIVPEGDAVSAPMAPEPLSASAKAAVKTAATPKKVEDISSGVSGKLQGGKGSGTIGNEQAFDAKKPVIPSNVNGSKIRGEKDTIPEATLPDIPADSSTMGDEANTLKGTPPVSNEMRGRVIAGNKGVTKEAKKPTLVDGNGTGVEGTLDNGGKSTIGNEQAFDAKKPAIPEGGSKAKIEGEKDTIPEAGLPDIPADNDLIGGEKETQKGMPSINTDIRGRVIADAKRDGQLAKITAARHKKACQVAAKYVGMGRIAESDFDDVVEDLSKIEVDRIETFAERLFRNVKVAGATSPVLSTPIVQEASTYRPELPKTLADQLKGIFTVGTAQLNQRVIEDDRADSEKQNG